MGGKPLLSSMKPDFPAVIIGFSFKYVVCAHIVHMFFLLNSKNMRLHGLLISKDYWQN